MPTTTSSTTTSTPTPTGTTPAATAPPNIVIPAPAAGFTPVNLLSYRGFRARAEQVNAATGAIQELQTNPAVYASTFGPNVPSAATFATDLTNAMGWSALRTSAEALLEYIKTYEAVTWKTALLDIQRVDLVFTMLAKQNAPGLENLPELVRLLSVPKVDAQKAAATRARNAKAKATAATPAPAVSGAGATASTAPAAGVPTSTTVTVTGGAGH